MLCYAAGCQQGARPRLEWMRWANCGIAARLGAGVVAPDTLSIGQTWPTTAPWTRVHPTMEANENEQEFDVQEADLRPSRTSERRDRKESESALAKLSIELCSLAERRIIKLELPDATLEVILAARRVPVGTARNRALRLVRQHLRDVDWRDLAQKLDADGAPRRRPTPAKPDAVAQWRTLLVDDGERALAALIAERPQLDRREIRVLVRNLKKATPKTEARARQALDAALKSLVGLEPPGALTE